LIGVIRHVMNLKAVKRAQTAAKALLCSGQVEAVSRARVHWGPDIRRRFTSDQCHEKPINQ
jgi:hypothetical protein